MFLAFSTGFFLGLSLIIAIGAQNAFVLRQGILRQHVFFIAIFCSISDSLLIIIGITGISYFLNEFINEYHKIILGFSALWLSGYGVLRLRDAFKNQSIILNKNIDSKSFFNTFSIITVFTFANPHVYLDTMILIGSVSQKFMDINKIFFALGACSASFVWFFCISYGARLLTPIMQKPSNWCILDLSIALIMFAIAINLLIQGNWI